MAAQRKPMDLTDLTHSLPKLRSTLEDNGEIFGDPVTGSTTETEPPPAPSFTRCGRRELRPHLTPSLHPECKALSRKYGHHQALLLQEDGHHCHRCYFRLIHPCFPPHRFDWPQYYRAPELIFRAPDYISNTDIYSAGCALAELLLGQLIFPWDSGVEQLVEMIKEKEQTMEMSQVSTTIWPCSEEGWTTP
ncbi:uncharacterized protein [Narcine bancroftii]|uniref:uncharacterized protein n=1 Tax=Narcine bancroftii TaxID=1343680 RepID=UPI003831672A